MFSSDKIHAHETQQKQLYHIWNPTQIIKIAVFIHDFQFPP